MKLTRRWERMTLSGLIRNVWSVDSRSTRYRSRSIQYLEMSSYCSRRLELAREGHNT